MSDFCKCGKVIYRENQLLLCLHCYNIKTKEYKLKPNICKANGCHCVLFMRNKSGFCTKHRHSHYMKEYIQRPNRKEHELKVRREYKKKNKAIISTRQRNREKHDLSFKIKRRLRHRLYCALKNNIKIGSSIEELGCSVIELKQHLESKFQSGMTWENYGLRGWHIDHIIPLDSFDLSDPEQLRKACHYTNLQPLWAKDNLVKSNKQGSHE
jgi:hypothetical protein